MPMLCRVAATVAVFFALTMNAFGAGPDSHPCAAVEDAAVRLACYDAAFPPVVGVADQARRDFGLGRADVRARGPAPEATPDRIEAVIVRLSERRTGERVVTLDNDQVWLLTDAGSRGPLTEGDRILIRKAAMSSHLLVTPGGIPLRAKRIR